MFKTIKKNTCFFETTVYREFTALPALKYASRANDCYVNKTLGQQLCAVCVPLVNECPYLIDHRFYGKSLSPFETAEANAYIESLGDDLIPETVKFVVKKPPYSALLFEGSYLKVDPISWWKSGKRLGFSESLIKVAVSLCSAVASSSGLERHFSRLGLTYGCLRTRLGVAKAGKLAFLHQQLNQLFCN